MPLLNETGEPLPKIELKPKEVKRIANLSKLRYPDNEERIFHLSPDDFRIWLYMLEPRDSLLLCSTYVTRQKIQRQMIRWRWSLITDWWWRMKNQ